MNIITAYPVIMNGKVVANKNAADTLNFSSAAGDNVFNMANPFATPKPSASPLFNTNPAPKTGPFNFPKPTTFGTPNSNPTPAQANDPANKGKVWDKAKGIFVKAKELGLLDGLLNRLGLGGAPSGGDTGITTQEQLPQEQGGGNTTKILLIAGGALVLITVIILATKSKGK